MSRTRGGKHRSLSNLQLRLADWQKLPTADRKGRIRPGSTNKRKQA